MPKLQLFIRAKQIQGKLANGWNGRNRLVHHVDMGGATNGMWMVAIVAQGTPDERIFDCISSPMGNLIGCIDQSIVGKNFQLPPKQKEKPIAY